MDKEFLVPLTIEEIKILISWGYVTEVNSGLEKDEDELLDKLEELNNTIK